MNPADMFTKPLHPQDFATCKTRVPGIFWGSDDGDDQMEVHMIQVQDDQEVSVSLKVQLFEALTHFLTWLSECAKLLLNLVGLFCFLRYVACPQRGKTTRSIGTQSQCTYTALRDVQQPRFLVLSEGQQGAFM